jgi:hypothetical protein
MPINSLGPAPTIKSDMLQYWLGSALNSDLGSALSEDSNLYSNYPERISDLLSRIASDLSRTCGCLSLRTGLVLVPQMSNDGVILKARYDIKQAYC